MNYLNSKFIYGNSRVKLHTGDVLFCGDNFLYRGKLHRLATIDEKEIGCVNLTIGMRLKNKYVFETHRRDTIELLAKKTKKPLGSHEIHQ